MNKTISWTFDLSILELWRTFSTGSGLLRKISWQNGHKWGKGRSRRESISMEFGKLKKGYASTLASSEEIVPAPQKISSGDLRCKNLRWKKDTTYKFFLSASIYSLAKVFDACMLNDSLLKSWRKLEQVRWCHSFSNTYNLQSFLTLSLTMLDVRGSIGQHRAGLIQKNRASLVGLDRD